ncbi:3-oxoacyl-[acyl-carrier-protein] reductase FabG [Andreesenia angusta]|uniref:3-oxoacyl-[acyl-carrier-protein] reductase FabG n=1 Tax=Andreesenia angusta TaxID=39480 RepID=A0A1S1V4S4_9FIRM|nr:SDR family oxidoreductase [Andreesenia angusta]OHW61666.1 3-oxoacyl-[acyl-carrier-protein] reductase FabG [Andreesenia angusta]
MSGKILIYGGSGAVGFASAELLKDAGYNLHLVGSNEEKLKAAAQKLGADISVADVKDPESFSKVAEEAGKELAGLVYAVGSINLKSLRRLSVEDFIEDFRLNSLGAALAIQSSLSALKKHKNSSIVLYSSVAVQQGLSMHASLSMSKGAVEGLVRSLAAELAPDIRVNGIAPSLLGDSSLSSSILRDEKTVDSMAKTHALKRLGSASDIASLTAFLISEKASWITGQIMGVDGGRSVIQA